MDKSQFAEKLHNSLTGQKMLNLTQKKEAK